MNESPEKSVLFIRAIPRQLKQEFKAWCDKQGKTMTETVIEWMKEKANVHEVKHDL